MNQIFRIPSQAYDYINSNYGWFGVLFAALLLVLSIVSVCVWLDRRR